MHPMLGLGGDLKFICFPLVEYILNSHIDTMEVPSASILLPRSIEAARGLDRPGQSKPQSMKISNGGCAFQLHRNN